MSSTLSLRTAFQDRAAYLEDTYVFYVSGIKCCIKSCYMMNWNGYVYWPENHQDTRSSVATLRRLYNVHNGVSLNNGRLCGFSTCEDNDYCPMRECLSKKSESQKTYRTFAFVRKQTEDLARQVSARNVRPTTKQRQGSTNDEFQAIRKLTNLLFGSLLDETDRCDEPTRRPPPTQRPPTGGPAVRNCEHNSESGASPRGLRFPMPSPLRFPMPSPFGYTERPPTVTPPTRDAEARRGPTPGDASLSNLMDEFKKVFRDQGFEVVDESFSFPPQRTDVGDDDDDDVPDLVDESDESEPDNESDEDESDEEQLRRDCDKPTTTNESLQALGSDLILAMALNDPEMLDKLLKADPNESVCICGQCDKHDQMPEKQGDDEDGVMEEVD